MQMRAQLIEQIWHRRDHDGRIDISAGELRPVFQKPLWQRVVPLGESDTEAGAGINTNARR
jgi:hypothetical protein